MGVTYFDETGWLGRGLADFSKGLRAQNPMEGCMVGFFQIALSLFPMDKPFSLENG